MHTQHTTTNPLHSPSSTHDDGDDSECVTKKAASSRERQRLRNVKRRQREAVATAAEGSAGEEPIDDADDADDAEGAVCAEDPCDVHSQQREAIDIEADVAALRAKKTASAERKRVRMAARRLLCIRLWTFSVSTFVGILTVIAMLAFAIVLTVIATDEWNSMSLQRNDTDAAKAAGIRWFSTAAWLIAVVAVPLSLPQVFNFILIAYLLPRKWQRDCAREEFDGDDEDGGSGATRKRASSAALTSMSSFRRRDGETPGEYSKRRLDKEKLILSEARRSAATADLEHMPSPLQKYCERNCGGAQKGQTYYALTMGALGYVFATTPLPLFILWGVLLSAFMLIASQVIKFSLFSHALQCLRLFSLPGLYFDAFRSQISSGD